MSRDELIELLKYCSPNILYVVEGQNKIIKLHTPFPLLVLNDIGSLYKNQIVFCTELKITYEGKIVFHVGGKNYHLYHFEVLT